MYKIITNDVNQGTFFKLNAVLTYQLFNEMSVKRKRLICRYMDIFFYSEKNIAKIISSLK